MDNKIYIIGHKSPDLDSSAAAIAYADLKNKMESADNYAPALAGEINKETEFALKKFGFEKPEVLNNAKEKNIILVDHNEFQQAVSGIEEAKIIEILDHHKVDFKYGEPIAFTVKPWGASCTIIADEFFARNIELDKNLAGLMLSAVLVDTVITKSPTCAEKDKEIITKLAGIAGITNWQEFGMELFKIRSTVSELSGAEIIKSDFKDFNFKAGKFGIGQVETVDLNEFAAREDEIINELNKLREAENYHSVILFITDIIKEGSEFLVSTVDQLKVEEALGAKLKNGKVYINGMISRKKQVAPKFSAIFDK
ncbi:manganese-dependent inorganic pyrophosphatase [Patescibacteria group bacterium]|nr:manganese-dependent inorganic pyrophosphatase [Patescibacteria group bacterium]